MWPIGLVLPAATALLYGVRAGSDARGRALLAAIAVGMFLAAPAIPWSLLLFAGVRSPAVFWIADAVCLLAGIVLALRTARPASPPAPPVRGSWPAIAATATLLLVVGSIAVSYFAAASIVAPHGEWDAWAQWNLRARFFHRGLADGAWRDAFDPALAWSHADYPPLVSMSVARLWSIQGGESVGAPIALAGVLAASSALAAALSAWRMRGAARGCLVAAAILATPSFVRWAPSQCADTAIGFFMLSAFVLWQEERLLLAGFAAGLAAWTKNEGIAFLVLFLAIAAIADLRRPGRRGLRSWQRIVAGAAPALLAVAVFKLMLAPPSYFVVGQTLSQTLARVADSDRILFVGRALGRELWLSGASHVGTIPILVAFLALRGIDLKSSRASGWGAVAVVAMTTIYALGYLATPLDLHWQVRTSIDRLVLQLVPVTAWSMLSFAA
jgi:hypothetical protein